MFELINPYIAKILVSANNGDSIRQISQKIQESYGWTHKWVLELEKIGALKRKKQEVYINKNSIFYKKILSFIVSSLKYNLSLNDSYLLPNLTGLEYLFTGIDAVFVWTKGGYNIGRNKDSYPIFIEILEKDKNAWTKYFSKFNIDYTFKNERKKGIYFIISFSKSIEKEYCENMPILPLTKTIEWAKKYSFNFQPALEMLDEMYNLKIGIKYSQHDEGIYRKGE
ncbi:hypothetical protein HYY70_03310 [Candidatus Woesearchaeota archaeon]|nr:hypothetical protein [Candidatus Woesearchaeota archaeon]